MIFTRPASLESQSVLTLCNEINSQDKPLVVECMPRCEGAFNDCFESVDAYVRQNGGERVLGWVLWEIPAVLLEAEFHAVWRSPRDGQLIDLNLREFRFPCIHFLPDPERMYEGRQVDNMRRALCDDPKLKQFIYLKGRQFALLNAGELAKQHGAIDQSNASKRLLKEYNALTKQINALIPALSKLARSRQ